MKKKKMNVIKNVIYVVIILSLIGVIWFGGTHDWFKFIIDISGQNQSIMSTPNPQSIYTSCNQVCHANEFSNSYDFISSCNEGETKITYGYPNKEPLLVCCCFNYVETDGEDSCVDSDGNDRYTPGHVTSDGIMYYDKCLDVGEGVTEYTCVDGVVTATNLACDYRQTCVQTRSGGYCESITPTWSPGDTVWSGGGTASLIGSTPISSTLDLSDYGLSEFGTCRLGVQFCSSWDYTNDKCQGITGIQGIRWEMYDSLGLEYSRTDDTPISLCVDLHPESHIWNWNPQTNWRASINPTLPLPECSITYEWNARIYIYDCL